MRVIYSAYDDRKRRVTVRHLLTMTGGFDWREDLPYTDPNNAASLMEASPDWVEFTINRRWPRSREIPEYDPVVVFTRWNIHDDPNKRFGHRAAIGRIIRAVVGQPGDSTKQ